ncbi:AMP-binding protein [Leucobacter rhizosphaerae]|uniref:AMP-binding protein n=1 Tax=Leucobacter rhizosphaerae TaxID=2932245 RepID=A0ABY4FUJ4_9MICO|nr:AMP-binding protein [Leucobacter rhizosphaerae]UOQ59829.1 AMP-binding protein [Leucobacter rhizosphaerae]
MIEAERIRSDAPLLRWADTQWTVSEFADAARACAQRLAELGVQRGQRVAIVSGNSEWRLAWQYGIYWLGAVEVSINSELRGAMLQHCLEDSDPSLIVAENEFTPYLAGILDTVSRVDADATPAPATHEAARLLDEQYATIAAADLSTILYTSGTTGPSKGVMLSQGYFANLGSVFGSVLEMHTSDVGYFTLPFFHVDFHIVFAAAIQSGATIAFNRRFSVSRFWEEASRFDASWVFVIGALLSALETREVPSHGHRVTRFIGAPIPSTSRSFFGQAGIRIQAFYGQTECDGPTFETVDRHRDGSAGWACAGIEVEIHSPEGEPLSAGSVGEIVLRPTYPNMLSLGYWRRPEATLASRVSLWHHTGDLGRFDEDGFLYYEGRLTDSLRRRGENISAYELEAVLKDAPHMVECAAVSVHDALGGEDEIKIVARVAEQFDPEAFFRFCAQQLPRFAVPRFIELVPSGTFVYSVGTGVIQKHRLSKQIEGDTIYDRVLLLGESR